MLPAAYRAHWALVSTSTTLALHPRVKCAVQRPSRCRRSRGGDHPRHHCPSWFPTDSSCLVMRLPCCVMGVWTSFFSSVGGGGISMGRYVKEEVQMPTTGKLEGEQQCTAHADVPGKSKRVELDQRSSAISGWELALETWPCRHSSRTASPLATAQSGKA